MTRAVTARVMRRAFNRASATFDSAAVLHRELLTRLLTRLEIIKSTPQVIVDLGSGTGHGSRALKRLFPRAQVIAVDFAESMLRVSRKQQSWWRGLDRSDFDRVCADGRQLPFKTESVDWVISNAMLHCCEPPDALFTEVQRVLKPGGVFSFSTFGPDTLRELRAAFTQLNDPTAIQPAAMQSFIDMHDLGDALLRAGFGDPVLDIEPFTLTYPNLPALLGELKATGSMYPSTHQGLGGRNRRAALIAAYEPFRQQDLLPVSVEAVFGLAWQPQNPRRASQRPSETLIPISALRHSTSRRAR